MSDPTALPNFPPPADEHPLRGRLLDVFVDLGLEPAIDEEGDIAVTVNDQKLFARTVEAELTFYRLFGQWQIGDNPASPDPALQLPEIQDRHVRTCNEINLAVSFAKTAYINDTLVVATEHLVGPGTDLRESVSVSVQAVLTAVQAWHQRFFDTGEGSTTEDGTAPASNEDNTTSAPDADGATPAAGDDQAGNGSQA